MSGWALAAQAGMQLLDTWAGMNSAHNANRTNIMLARENRDWLTEMSNTSVQRHVKDLMKAGLNPMLGYMNQASTPGSAPARVEPTYRSGSSKVDPMGLALMKAQTENIQAQTAATIAQARKTTADASMTEAAVPYSGFSAEMSARNLSAQFTRLGLEIDKLLSDVDVRQLEAAQLRELQPLIREFQALQNKAKAAEIPAKEAEAKFFENVPEAKWLLILRQVFGR